MSGGTGTRRAGTAAIFKYSDGHHALFNKDVDFFIFIDAILDDEFNIHFHYISTDEYDQK